MLYFKMQGQGRNRMSNLSVIAIFSFSCFFAKQEAGLGLDPRKVWVKDFEDDGFHLFVSFVLRSCHACTGTFCFVHQISSCVQTIVWHFFCCNDCALCDGIFRFQSVTF